MTIRTTLLVGTILFSAVSFDANAESPAIVPSIAISNLSVVEGDSGMTPFTATVSLTNYYSAILPVTVKVTATPGTASEKDYVFTTTQVTLGTDAGVQTVSGFIIGDIEPEGDETFSLTATAVATDGGYAPYLYSSGGMLTIKDDDQARASRLHAEGVNLLEGDNGVKQVEIRVALEPASTSDVKVRYQSQDGTATAKLDYQPVSGTLSFAPGEVLKTIVVDIIGDTQPEPDETFSVVLSDPSMALLGTARADVVIVNDDVASTPLDALPPVGIVEPQPDGGAEGKLDARDDARPIDLGGAYGFDSRPVEDNDARMAGNDAGMPGGWPGNNGGASGLGGSSGNDSGAGGQGAGFGGGCSCSVGDSSHGSTHLPPLLGAALFAAWLRRKRS
jgi:MYXO-CTERM domain-containing protein